MPETQHPPSHRPKSLKNTGLYSRYFTSLENQALASLAFDDLGPEIKLFRILLMRLLASEQGAGHPLALGKRIAGLRVIGQAASTLGGLVRAQVGTANPLDEAREIFQRGVKNANQEQGVVS